MALFTFKNKYLSSCSRFVAHIVSIVILTNYECTQSSNKTKCLKHFTDTQKPDLPFAHLLGLKTNAIDCIRFKYAKSSTCNRVHLHIVFVLLCVLWVCRSVGVLSHVFVIRSFTYALRVVI